MKMVTLNKFFVLLFTVLLVLLISIHPVEAGWLDKIVKSLSKNIKSVGKVDSMRAEARAEQKTAQETLEQKVSKTESKREQLALNIQRGQFVEKNVGKGLCQYTKCFETYTSAKEAIEVTIPVGYNIYYGVPEFILRGGSETRKFLQSQIDSSFSAMPDYVRIKQQFGKIQKLEIIDAKASATASRDAQENAFIQLCNKANNKGIECSVSYIYPKSKAEAAKKMGLGDIVYCVWAIANDAAGPFAVADDTYCAVKIYEAAS